LSDGDLASGQTQKILQVKSSPGGVRKEVIREKPEKEEEATKEKIAEQEKNEEESK
jgi:hypothetical protein